MRREKKDERRKKKKDEKKKPIYQSNYERQIRGPSAQWDGLSQGKDSGRSR